MTHLPDTNDRGLLGLLQAFFRQRRTARLRAELDPHLLFDIGLLDVEPRVRHNRPPRA